MSVIETPSSPRAQERGGGGKPRIAFFSAEWCMGPQINLGGSDYWRMALPASKLYDEGWDVIFCRNLADHPSGRIVVQDPSGAWRDDRDIVVMQRWMSEGTDERVRTARENGQIIINEVDDDYWRMPDIHVSEKTVDPEKNKASNRDHYRRICESSSLVTVSSQYLLDELGSWGPPVRLIRNYIDVEFWPETPPGDYIGWVGGLPWRGRDMEILRDNVIPWMRERKLFFYHGGQVADAPMEDRLGYDRVSSRPLCQILQYVNLWEPLRIALIPIEDTPFGRAKSWVKGLEACARGIPFIHSPHAEYDLLGVGLCAREPRDWVRHLEALRDPGFYNDQCARNRARAKELSIATNWKEWAGVLLEAAAKA